MRYEQHVVHWGDGPVNLGQANVGVGTNHGLCESMTGGYRGSRSPYVGQSKVWNGGGV